MSGHDIFISYSRQERTAARLFAESLAQEGFSVWWDAVLHSGETFDEVIERELRAAKAVVVLWSPRSVISRWVRAEATQADRLNKLVPVKIEDCNLPIIFELTHTAELAEWKGDRSDASWQSLIFDLRRMIGPAKEQAAAPEVVAEPPVAQPPAPAPEVPEAIEEPKAETAEAKPRTSREQEIADALERLANPKESALQEPTPIEDAQAKFFQRSDEYRRHEGEMVHCLRRVHAPDSEPVHIVTASGLKIGRAAPADVIVYEPGVSREHCLVELAADKLRVSDLNSTNGTYIDDKRIGRAEILPVGSVLRVGNVSFEHEVHSRGDMQQPHDPANINLDEPSREARIARPS